MTTTTPPAGARAGQVVAFTLGGEEYALPIDQIREVIRYTRPRPVTSSDPRMLGVIVLRETIVPITDLAATLGLHVAHDEDAKIVILEAGEHASAGVIVDDVKEVLTIHDSEIEPRGDTGTQTIAKVGDRLLVMLDVCDILDRDQLGE